MSIKASIIADSVNPVGNRLTTFVCEFPRWVLAELNTHRVLSRNTASSRAIPIEKMIQMVIDNPAIPVFWGKNQSGMQSLEELTGEELENAKKVWLECRDRAVQSAKALAATGMHKQYCNRLIENFMYVRTIVSGTDWHNFFALRAHIDAQPELRELAYKMLDIYNSSKPKELKPGEWHIPFGDNIDENRLNTSPSVLKLMDDLDKAGFCGDMTSHFYAKQEIKKKISIARCARVSYFNFEGKDDYEADVKLCDKLFLNNPKHCSPLEHVAQCLEGPTRIGNFIGFKQYRKFIQDENIIRDERIKL